MKVIITESYIVEVSEKGFNALKEDTGVALEKCDDAGLTGTGEKKVEEYKGDLKPLDDWDDEFCGVEEEENDDASNE